MIGTDGERKRRREREEEKSVLFDLLDDEDGDDKFVCMYIRKY